MRVSPVSLRRLGLWLRLEGFAHEGGEDESGGDADAGEGEGGGGETEGVRDDADDERATGLPRVPNEAPDAEKLADRVRWSEVRAEGHHRAGANAVEEADHH